MRGSRATPSLRQRALMWLAQREHSRRELQAKLQRWVQALETTQGRTTAASRMGEEGDDLARATPQSASRSIALSSRPSVTESSATPSSGPRPALPDAGQITALLDDLEAAGHLSNERVLESRIQVRSARFGNLRIERELQHLGVEPSDEARSALRSTEVARARAVWERKFGAAPGSAAERARQMRFLAARGFTAETIRAVLSPRSQDLEDDDGFS
jgi:regulatory protein